jgi:hypothetical protein
MHQRIASISEEHKHEIGELFATASATGTYVGFKSAASFCVYFSRLWVWKL